VRNRVSNGAEHRDRHSKRIDILKISKNHDINITDANRAIDPINSQLKIEYMDSRIYVIAKVVRSSVEILSLIKLTQFIFINI